MTPTVVHEFLGAPKFLDEEIAERTKRPGVAIGLAWTPVGGEVLFIEASRMSGAASLTLTGQLGDVMKESARAALSWVRAHAAQWSIDPDFFKSSEIHVHVPSGAIPKDGPSAGVTMATALVSELTRRPVRGDVAMTGEITLSGKVLPVGGIKEKVLAAKRAGVREIILPRQNEKNVKEDLDADLRAGLTIHLVGTIDEVLLLALVPVRQPAAKRSPRRVAGVDAVAACGRLSRVRVVYSPRYHLDFGAHVFPTAKYRRVAADASRTGLVPDGFVEPEAATWDGAGAGPRRRLPRPPCAAGTLTADDRARLEIPVLTGDRRRLPPDDRRHAHRRPTGARWRRSRRRSTSAAASTTPSPATARASACSTTWRSRSASAQQARRAGRAAVVDLDVHHGNGTAAIFAGDARVFTLSMHEAGNYPYVKPPSSARHRFAATALATPSTSASLEGALARTLEHLPDVVFYLAGADPYLDDQLGGLALTQAGLRRRDRLVFEAARSAGVPIVVRAGRRLRAATRRHRGDPRRHHRRGRPTGDPRLGHAAPSGVSPAGPGRPRSSCR